MKTLCILSISLLAAAMASAQPAPSIKRPDARKLYDEFDRTLSATSTWGNKRQPERTKAVKDAMELQARFDKALGQRSQCSAAAAAHVEYVTNLNRIGYFAELGSGGLSAFQQLGALGAAENFGTTRAACFEEIEALK